MIGNKKAIVLLNKTDLDTVVTEEMLVKIFEKEDIVIIKTSTKENTGIDIFEDKIVYLPIQNFENISLTKSSSTSSPIIVPREA
mgnify:CR=1 FL=1